MAKYQVPKLTLAGRMVQDVMAAFEIEQPYYKRDYDFVNRLSLRYFRGINLTKRQFDKLEDLHRCYTKGWRCGDGRYE